MAYKRATTISVAVIAPDAALDDRSSRHAKVKVAQVAVAVGVNIRFFYRYKATLYALSRGKRTHVFDTFPKHSENALFNKKSYIVFSR